MRACLEAVASPWDQGANSGSSATLRGPTRRSYSGAIPLRQLATASLRSASVNLTWTSFSASANVSGDTSGPTGGAVAKAGGVPAGASAGLISGLLQEETATPKSPRELLVRNCLRDFDMAPLLRILECDGLEVRKTKKPLRWCAPRISQILKFPPSTPTRSRGNPRRVPQVSRLRPGIPATHASWTLMT